VKKRYQRFRKFLSVLLGVALMIPLMAMQAGAQPIETLNGGEFVPVTGIVGLPTATVPGAAGQIDLQAATIVVQPANATNQTISWEVNDPGETGAFYMAGQGQLFFDNPGTAIIRARILNGLTPTTDFVQDFTITVTAEGFVSVTGITDLPSTANIGQPLVLSGFVQPFTATNRTIAWSVVAGGGTGAAITSGNVFTASAEGTATVRASVANGVTIGQPFVLDFPIEVVESTGAVTRITGIPSQLTVITTPFTLRGVAEPACAVYDSILWTVQDAGTTGAVITDNVINVTALGTVVVRASIVGGATPSDFYQDFTLEVVEPRFTIQDTGNGWTRIVNQGGETLGIANRANQMEIIVDDGWAFKDMAGDGVLHPYVDWRLSGAERAEDLKGRLSINQILGLMMHSGHNTAPPLNAQGQSSMNATQNTLINNGVRAVLSLPRPDGQILPILRWHNLMQTAAEERCSLSIPINFSSDPRDYGAGDMDMTLFPPNMGVGASFCPDLALEIQIAKSAEFRAMGITTYLGPMIDLASEPRWYRFSQTFTEDPAMLVDMTDASISGFQSTWGPNGEDLGWGPDSVITMMKHWTGDGASEGGRASHVVHGHFNVFPGAAAAHDGNPYPGFRTHYKAFVDGGLFPNSEAGPARAMMSNYSISWDPGNYRMGPHFATAYNPYRNNLARRYGFRGPITTDWGITTRQYGLPSTGTTIPYLLYRIIMAGTDQFGGMSNLANIQGAWNIAIDRHGYEVARARFEESGRRFTENFFLLGIFDNPYIYEPEALGFIANPDHMALGHYARQRGIVMLSNNITTIEDDVEVHTPVITENWVANQWPGDARPTVYVPYVLRDGQAGAGAAFGWRFPQGLSVAALSEHFNVITDVRTGNGPGGIQRAAPELVATADFAIVFAGEPLNPGGWNRGWAAPFYRPLSLQFEPYQAVGPYVRRESIAGHPVIARRSETDPTIFVTVERPIFGHAPVQHATPPIMIGPIADRPGFYYARENRSYYGHWDTVNNREQLTTIRYAAEHVDGPVILGMDLRKPYIFAEAYDYVDAILVSFEYMEFSPYIDIILGKVEPTGLLPVQMPLDMDAVERQKEDLPRDMDVFVCSRGNAFDFAFGLSWDGRIQDERTARYDVPVQGVPSNNPEPFIPVVDIANVPNTIAMGEEVTLAGYVVPGDASMTTIIWGIYDAGTTEAVIVDGNIIVATDVGTVRVRASVIAGGLGHNIFSTIFDIEVVEPVPTEITVTFNPNGGTVNPTSRIATIGATFGGAFPMPSRPGYAFQGWFTAREGGVRILGTALVTKSTDITLYARWQGGQQIRIDFNPNGGTVAETHRMATVGNPNFGGVFPTPSRTGFIFEGWFTRGGTRILGTNRVNLVQDTELIARWRAAGDIVVTFNPNGGVVSPTSRTVTPGSVDFSGAFPRPQRLGYIFQGWFTVPAATGGARVMGTQPVTQTTNFSIYARWTPSETITVTFDPAGGVVSPTSRVVTRGDTFGGAFPMPTKPGFVFTGWVTAGGHRIVGTNTVTNTEDLVLFARWDTPTMAVKVDLLQ